MSNEVYSIPDWDAKFETAESRKLKRLTWIAMNILFDTDQYAELASHPNGAAHLGCWTAIVMAAAKAAKRGTLVRTNGLPHSAESLALLTRLPLDVFNEALPRLVQIGLIRASAETSADFPGTPADFPATPVLQYKTEQDRQTEQNRTPPNPTSESSAPQTGLGRSSAVQSAREELRRLEARFATSEKPSEFEKLQTDIKIASEKLHALETSPTAA